MADDDSEDDLWADFENGEVAETVSVSSNLSQLVGLESQSPDLSKMPLSTWVPPTFHGLGNSDAVDKKGAHWDKSDAPAPASSLVSSVPPVNTTPGTMSFDWNTMSLTPAK